MAFKSYEIDGIGTVTVYKRQGSRSMRMSITSDGRIRVTIPTYIPYISALSFVESKRGWISLQNAGLSYLENAQQIGKEHRLRFVISFSAAAVSTRVTETDIVIRHPAKLDTTSPDVQSAARSACIRALRQEAEKLLPSRLKEIADTYGFEYKSCQIKQLKGRWGSCDQKKAIVLNLYLMKLPWELVDYVLLHELIHTVHLDHSDKFWKLFITHQPKARSLREKMKKWQPNFSDIPGS